MKKLIIAALVAGIATAPAMATPYNGHDVRGRVEQTQRTVTRTVVARHEDRRAGHDWRRGQRFDSRYAPNYRVISNPAHYRLHAAPRGYHWVRSGSDAVLVGITTGIVASVLADSIR